MTENEIEERLEEAQRIVREESDFPNAWPRIEKLRDECPAQYHFAFNSLQEALIVAKGE